MLDITPYHVLSDVVTKPVKLALLSDLHNGKYDHVLAAIRREKPDAVVIAGDQMEPYANRRQRGLQFLCDAIKEFPVFYGLGNHERDYGTEDLAEIRRTGAVLLVNESVRFGDLCIGGIAPDKLQNNGQADASHLSFLEQFEKEDGYRVLLCHRPEWYVRHVRNYDIPLTLSGHAHGGQIRIFGQPLYSPGQGLFPRYAQGMHENRLIVCRGLGNQVNLPRLWNHPEICIITIGA